MSAFDDLAAADKSSSQLCDGFMCFVFCAILVPPDCVLRLVSTTAARDCLVRGVLPAFGFNRVCQKRIGFPSISLQTLLALTRSAV